MGLNIVIHTIHDVSFYCCFFRTHLISSKSLSFFRISNRLIRIFFSFLRQPGRVFQAFFLPIDTMSSEWFFNLIHASRRLAGYNRIYSIVVYNRAFNLFQGSMGNCSIHQIMNDQTMKKENAAYTSGRSVSSDGILSFIERLSRSF